MNRLILVALLVVAVAFADDASTRGPRGPGGPGGPGGMRGRGGAEGRPRGGPMRDMEIEGVSEENMAKLNEQIKAAQPLSPEDAKVLVESWAATLPEAEQAAVKAHREQMMKHKGKHHSTTPSS